MAQLEDKLLFSFISTLGVFTQASDGYRLCLCATVSTLTPPSPVSAAPRPLTLQAHHRQLAANFSFVSAAEKKKKNVANIYLCTDWRARPAYKASPSFPARENSVARLVGMGR